MKPNVILHMYTKYNEVIEKPSTDVINRFENFMKWLNENYEPNNSFTEGDIQLAVLNTTIKALNKKNINFNECVGWTESYHEKFFNLLNKSKESKKRDDSTTYLLFLYKIDRLLEEIYEKTNTTMFLYYWSHLYTQVLGDEIEKEVMKINQLAEETSTMFGDVIEKELNKINQLAEETSTKAEVTEIYLVAYEDVTAAAPTSDTRGYKSISAITLASGAKFVKVLPAKNSASFEDALVVEDQGEFCVKYHTHTLTFSMTLVFMLNNRFDFDNLSLKRYIAVVKTADNYLMLGRTAGLEAETATLNSNGIQIVMSAKIGESVIPVVGGAIETVEDNPE